MSDKKDFTIEGGEVRGLPANPSNFEYGERFVKCRACGLSRTGKELQLVEFPQGHLPVCKGGCRPL